MTDWGTYQTDLDISGLEVEDMEPTPQPPIPLYPCRQAGRQGGTDGRTDRQTNRQLFIVLEPNL